MSPKPKKPSDAQRAVMERLASGERFVDVLNDLPKRVADRINAALPARGWVVGGRLSPEGAEAIGVNPDPFRLPAPPPVVIERVELPGRAEKKTRVPRRRPDSNHTDIPLVAQGSFTTTAAPGALYTPKTVVFDDDACVVNQEELDAQAREIKGALEQAGDGEVVEVSISIEEGFPVDGEPTISAEGPVTATARRGRLHGLVSEIEVEDVVVGVELAAVPPPGLPLHKTPEGEAAQALHDRLVAGVREIERGFMVVAQDIAKAYEGRIWEFLGYTDPAAYFGVAVGLQERTVLALKAIAGALVRLPEGEREAAAKALALIGRHKASVIVPVLGNHAQPWQHWVNVAANVRNERALQAIVSQATGAQPRGVAAVERDYSAEFMKRTIEGLAPRYQRRATAVWMAYAGYLAQAAGRPQPLDSRSAFLGMIEIAQLELAQAGIEITVTDE